MIPNTLTIVSVLHLIVNCIVSKPNAYCTCVKAFELLSLCPVSISNPDLGFEVSSTTSASVTSAELMTSGCLGPLQKPNFRKLCQIVRWFVLSAEMYFHLVIVRDKNFVHPFHCC